MLAERAGRESRGGNAQVARRFVEPECEPAAERADEIDLHHDGHRPREPLIQAEEDVGQDDDPPARRERDQSGNGKRHEPAEDEEPLPADAPGEAAGGEVRERLGDAEGDDEGEDGALRGEPEVVLPDQREHATLEADHRADEGIQRNEQSELAGVGPQSEPNGDGGHRRAGESPRRLAVTIDAWPTGGGGTSTSSAEEKLSASV
jgi:hypothetical protein